LYINELLIRLLPKDASQEDLFNLYEDFLTKIHSGDDIEFTLRHFELDLLDMLGYGLDFESDIDKNEQIDPDKNYSFIPSKRI
jgi:DNA repair protein RecO (recombination protein O)